jgi:hypothetical protein
MSLRLACCSPVQMLAWRQQHKTCNTDIVWVNGRALTALIQFKRSLQSMQFLCCGWGRSGITRRSWCSGRKVA